MAILFLDVCKRSVRLREGFIELQSLRRVHPGLGQGVPPTRVAVGEEDAVAVCQPGMRKGIPWILGDGPLEVRDRFRDSICRSLIPEVPTLEVEVVRIRARGRCAHERRVAHELRLQRLYD